MLSNDMVVHNFDNEITCNNRTLRVQETRFNDINIIALYSYNTIISFKYEGVTYLNDTRYSNTTSKHQSLVKRYCDVSLVNDNFFDFYLGLKVKKNVTSYKLEIKNMVKKFNNARLYKHDRMIQLTNHIDTLRNTVDTFYKVDKRSKWYKEFIAIISDPVIFFDAYDIKQKALNEKAIKVKNRLLKKEEKEAREWIKTLSTKKHYELKIIAKLNDIYAKFPILRNNNLINFMTIRNALKLPLKARLKSFKRFYNHDINRHLLSYINAIIKRDSNEIKRRFNLVNIEKLYDLFMNGKIKEISRDYMVHGDTFRIKGNHLISTQNVTLSFNDARKFYIAYKAKKLQLNEIIAGFRITAIEEDHIQIGCHRFEPNNIEKVYNLIKGL